MALGYYYTVPETKHNMTIIGYGNNRIEMAADSGRFVGNWKPAGSGNYTLPVATTSQLGGVIQGYGLSVDGTGRLGAIPYTKYYVDPANGNDSNDGKTTSTAFKTLSKLLTYGVMPTYGINIVEFVGTNPTFTENLNVQRYNHIEFIISGKLTVNQLYFSDCGYICVNGHVETVTDGPFLVQNTNSVFLKGNCTIAAYITFKNTKVHIKGLFTIKSTGSTVENCELLTSSVPRGAIGSLGGYKCTVLDPFASPRTEWVTGETYRGVPVYAQSFDQDLSTSGGGSGTGAPLGVTINQLVSLDWTVNTNTAFQYSQNYYAGSTDYLRVVVNKTTGYIMVYFGADFVAGDLKDFTGIIKYTK
jgi:hypothetical protein